MINIKDKYILLNAPKCGSTLLSTVLRDIRLADPEDFIEELQIHIIDGEYSRPLWNVSHTLHRNHTLSQSLLHLPKNHKIDDYDVCVLTRNPYSRLVSLFHQDLCYKISRTHHEMAYEEGLELDDRLELINQNPLNAKKSFVSWLREHSFNDFELGVFLYQDQVKTIHKRYDIDGLSDSLSSINWSRQWPVSRYIDITTDSNIRTYKYENYLDEVGRFFSDLNLSKYSWNSDLLQRVSEFKCENSHDPCVDCNLPRADWSVYYEDMDGDLINAVNDYYKDDFERFGYEYITP